MSHIECNPCVIMCPSDKIFLQLLAVFSPGSLPSSLISFFPLVLVYCCCYCLPLQGPEDLAPHPLTTGSELISAVLPLEHMSSPSAPALFPPLSLDYLTLSEVV